MAQRLHEVAFDALLRRIVAGEFAAGMRLPKEQDVASQYAMNRGTAREALRALEERHVAIVKHGRGSTVQEQTTWDVLEAKVGAALLAGRGRTRFAHEIRYARGVVEPELAALAAEHATEVDRDVLVAALAQQPADAEFAAALGRIARNRPLAATAHALRRVLPPPAAPAGALREVLDAVAEPDPVGARAAMRCAVHAANPS